MPLEIEWKFLVTRLPAPLDGPHDDVEQGYLCAGSPGVRVRVMSGRGFLTIKGSPLASAPEGEPGPVVRPEFEYEIPLADAHELLAMTSLRVTKRRYWLPNSIEVDVFDGPLAGLIVAEYETETPGPPPPPPPGWEWRDVSLDKRYTNRSLAESGLPADCVKAVVGAGRA